MTSSDYQPDLFLSGAPIVPATKAMPESRLPVEWINEMNPSFDGIWLVKDWFPKVGVVTVYGHPRSGKSLLLQDLAVRVAVGEPWFGLDCEKGSVAYVAAEGASGVRVRMTALRQSYPDIAEKPLAMIPQAVDLFSNSGDLKKLNKTLSSIETRAETSLALVIIDTVSKTLGKGDENSGDIAQYVRNCEAIAQQFQCCVVLVHHRPKADKNREPRGHSSLAGGVDTMILVERKRRDHVASVEKQKDGPDGAKLTFTVSSRKVGETSIGEDVYSVIVEHGKITCGVDLPDPVQKALRSNLKEMLSLIESCIDEGVCEPINVRNEDDEFVAVEGVRLDTLRKLFGQDQDKPPDTIRKAFGRQLNDIKALKIIDKNDYYVWICD